MEGNKGWTQRDFCEIGDLDFNYVMTYYEWSRLPRDYGTGEEYTLAEVHNVTFIEENPGITITSMAEELGRTKSAVSQIIKRLENLGLIYKLDSREDKKKFHLFVTPKGRTLSLAHKSYDTTHVEKSMEHLREHFSDEEINIFYRVLESRSEYMRESLSQAKSGKSL